MPRDSYLKSPIIELSVGKDDNVTILHAHQRLLEQSPVLEKQIATFGDENVRNTSNSTSLVSQC